MNNAKFIRPQIIRLHCAKYSNFDNLQEVYNLTTLKYVVFGKHNGKKDSPWPTKKLMIY